MKAEDLLEYIGDTDEAFLLECEQVVPIHTRRQKGNLLRSWIAAVATVVLLAGAGGIVLHENLISGYQPVSVNGTMRMAANTAVPQEEAVAEAETEAVKDMSLSNGGDSKSLTGDTEQTNEQTTNSHSENDAQPVIVIHFPMNENRRMVFVDGELYAENGAIDSRGHCGVTNGIITSMTEEVDIIPSENNQSNFGTDIAYQRCEWEGAPVLEVMIDGEWHVFRRAESPEELQKVQEDKE